MAAVSAEPDSAATEHCFFLLLLFSFFFPFTELFGSGALSGKMLLVRVIENDIIVDYFSAG